MSSYIAFIDLLGTSDLAHHDVAAYHLTLQNFHAAVDTQLTGDRQDLEVHLFSDCAYVASPDLVELVDYVRDVRSHLLERGQFLKGGIAEGSLAARRETRRNGRLRRTFFGSEAVYAYAIQENLKGVGVRIAKSLLKFDLNGEVKGPLYERVASSCFLSEATRSAVEPFWDLRYNAEDFYHVDAIVGTLHRLRIRSARIARYYVPPLVTMVRAGDYTSMFHAGAGLSLEEEFEEGRLPKVAVAVLRGDLRSLETKVPGVEQVYYALLDEVCRQTTESDSGIRARIFDFMSTERRKGRLRHVPLEICGLKSRSAFAEYASRRELDRNREVPLSDAFGAEMVEE